MERPAERVDDGGRCRHARRDQADGDVRLARGHGGEPARAGSRRHPGRAQESARLQDHGQADPRRRQPGDRDGASDLQHRRLVPQHAACGAGQVRRLRGEGRQRQPRRDQEAARHQARLHRRAGRAGQQLPRLGRGDRGRQLVDRQRRAKLAEGHLGRRGGRGADQRAATWRRRAIWPPRRRPRRHPRHRRRRIRHRAEGAAPGGRPGP